MKGEAAKWDLYEFLDQGQTQTSPGFLSPPLPSMTSSSVKQVEESGDAKGPSDWDRPL